MAEITYVALTGKEIDTWMPHEIDGKPVVHRELKLWGFELIEKNQWVQHKIVQMECYEDLSGLRVDDKAYLVAADIDDFRWADRVMSNYVYPLEIFTDPDEAQSFQHEYLLAHREGNPEFEWQGVSYPHVCLVEGVKFNSLRSRPLEFDGDRRE